MRSGLGHLLSAGEARGGGRHALGLTCRQQLRTRTCRLLQPAPIDSARILRPSLPAGLGRGRRAARPGGGAACVPRRHVAARCVLPKDGATRSGASSTRAAEAADPPGAPGASRQPAGERAAMLRRSAASALGALRRLTPEGARLFSSGTGGYQIVDHQFDAIVVGAGGRWPETPALGGPPARPACAGGAALDVGRAPACGGGPRLVAQSRQRRPESGGGDDRPAAVPARSRPCCLFPCRWRRPACGGGPV